MAVDIMEVDDDDDVVEDQKWKNSSVSCKKVLGKKHVLPHLRENGVNTLLDVMEAKNVGQSLRSNAHSTSSNIIRNHRRRQRASRTMN